jgi:hypothetical protein
VTRVVIDPGVLVSAFISSRRAAPALLVDALLDGRFEMVVTPKLIAELTDVLGRAKFSLNACQFGGGLTNGIGMFADVPELCLPRKGSSG